MNAEEHILWRAPRVLALALLFVFLNIRIAAGAETAVEVNRPADADSTTIGIPSASPSYALGDSILMKYRATGHEHTRPAAAQVGVILWDERKAVVGPAPVLQRTSGAGNLQNSATTAIRVPQ